MKPSWRRYQVKLMVTDSNNQTFKRKKIVSLCKLYNSTLCWFSISLSSFLKFLKDGLTLGSSFQHFVIMPYLKRTSKKFNYKQFYRSIMTKFFSLKIQSFYNNGRKIYTTEMNLWWCTPSFISLRWLVQQVKTVKSYGPNSTRTKSKTNTNVR